MSLLTLQIGQCGNQLGFEFFNVLAQDVGVGEPESCRDSEYYSASVERFFTVDRQGGLIASAVLVDTERKAVGRVLKDACYSDKWHYASGAAYTSSQGAGNNWALGYFEQAEKGMDEICNLVRRNAEQRDWLEGFLPIFSLAGGTGSGLGTKLTETLRDNYPKTPVVTAVVWPFKSGEVAVQAYNVLLSLAHLQDSADALLVLSNDSLHRVVTQRWALRSASLVEMNALAARHLACLLQPSQAKYGPFKYLGDVAADLGCFGSVKQVSLLQVPQEPPTMTAFSCSSWQSLVRALSKMQHCHSATDEVPCSFQAVYKEECAKCRVNQVTLMSADAPSLDVCVDEIREQEWRPILEALRVDKTLKVVVFKSWFLSNHHTLLGATAPERTEARLAVGPATT